MTNCDICGATLSKHVSTAEAPYAYEESGLRNVHLMGVDVYACATCGVGTAAIPRILELHVLIAAGVLRGHSPLTGAEFRFIRKQAGVGLPEFSERSGVERRIVDAFERYAGQFDSGVRVACRFEGAAWSLENTSDA